MLERMNIREHNDYAAQAALHGKKLKNQMSLDSLNAWESVEDSELNHDRLNADMMNILEENRNALKR